MDMVYYEELDIYMYEMPFEGLHWKCKSKDCDFLVQTM